MSEMAEAIRELQSQRGMSEDAIRQTIENAIKAAYKRTFGKEADNCIVKFNEDMTDMVVYARKTIVDGVYDPTQEIELADALKLSDECKEGDEIDIPLDIRDFSRSAISTGKQTAHQALNENFKKTLENEYKDKLGQTIIGYCQRLVPDKKGDKGAFHCYLDLGKNDRVEGFLPAKNQCPHEVHEKGERIKALIKGIKPMANGIQLVLSRSDPNFVRNIMEVEIPEISDKTITIKSIAREPGVRTKIAVYSNKLDIDPVGACVGQKGVRIQNVIKEIDGEKIDMVKYEAEPREFIKNALSPADVKKVYILDSQKKQAIAVVTEKNFSLAVGKGGLNVRLANRLCDWTIDVKTEKEAAEMELEEMDLQSRRAAERLFNTPAEEDVITTVAQLPGVDPQVAELLKAAGLEDIQQFLDAVEDGSIYKMEGVRREDVDLINKIINENVEIENEVEDAAVEDVEQEDGNDAEYTCPECGTPITLEMTKCPKCGAEFVFEEGEGK